MATLREAALASKAWPFEEARALLKRVEAGPAKDHVLFETGYRPAGAPPRGARRRGGPGSLEAGGGGARQGPCAVRDRLRPVGAAAYGHLRGGAADDHDPAGL